MFAKRLSLIALILISFCLLSCEDEDLNKLAKAQKCLDDLPANGAGVDACRGLLGNVSGQQADIIRCSIEMITGGITTARLTEAYLERESTVSEDVDAVLIGGLSMDTIALADTAYAVCKSAGLPAFVFLSGIARLGSYMSQAAGHAAIDIGSTGYPDDTEAEQLVDNCCGGNNAIVGQTIIDIFDSFCRGSSESICQQMDQAIGAVGGNPALVTPAFIAVIDKP